MRVTDINDSHHYVKNKTDKNIVMHKTKVLANIYRLLSMCETFYFVIYMLFISKP